MNPADPSPPELDWSRLTASEISGIVSHDDPIVILPVGSTEQHGPHLAVQVDTKLSHAVSMLTAERLSTATRTLVLPPVWVGLADHHMSFGGTLTVRETTFAAVITDLCDSLGQLGVRRILILNAHGGNIRSLGALAERLSTSAKRVRVATYFVAAREDFGAILERQPGVLHAGEAETSMMLALDPTCVRTDRVDEAHAEVPLTMAGQSGAFRPFSDFTKNGVIGDARSASADKGWMLLDRAAAAVASLAATTEYWTLE